MVIRSALTLTTKGYDRSDDECHEGGFENALDIDRRGKRPLTMRGTSRYGLGQVEELGLNELRGKRMESMGQITAAYSSSFEKSDYKSLIHGRRRLGKAGWAGDRKTREDLGSNAQR